MTKRVRPYAILSVVFVLVVSSLACSTGKPGERQLAPSVPATPTGQVEEATATPTLAPPTATLAPAATSKPVEVPPAEVPADQGPLEVAQIPELQITTLDPRGTPLGQLGTFRQKMRAEFFAPDSTYNGIYHYEAEVDTVAQAVHIWVTAEGTAAQQFPANRVEAIWIGTRLWIKVGNGPWVPVPEEVAEAQFDEQTVSVGQFLPYVPIFDRIQPDETVNSMPCVHYTYDAQDIPSEYGTVDTRGEIWVAIEGGYVVRYTLEAVGQFSEYFEGTGTLKLTYDTYDVGADIRIAAPRR
jgi:hypothetical protein